MQEKLPRQEPASEKKIHLSIYTWDEAPPTEGNIDYNTYTKEAMHFLCRNRYNLLFILMKCSSDEAWPQNRDKPNNSLGSSLYIRSSSHLPYISLKRC